MYKLVIIDDEFIVVEGIKAIIQREKIDCEVVGFAYDGIRALEVIREAKPDIVITDIRIPGLDGLSLIEAAKDFLPETFFIVISGYTEFEYARRALSLGVMSYIDKPVTIDKVKEAIERVDKKKQYRSEEKEKLEEMEVFRSRMNEHMKKIIQAIINESPEMLREESEIAVEEMRQSIAALSSFKQECFKNICVMTEVFAEQRKEKARKYGAVWSEIEGMDSYREVSSYIKKIVDQIADSIEVEKVGSSHRVVNQLLQYIEENYQRDIGLNELAERVGLNPAYLSILFKEEVGVSYVKYLTGLRVNKAKNLLDKGYKVVEVSEMVGYSNYRYFCDIFKKLEGKTPNEYKQRES